MKATGIVVEYNPFHNGHLHHLTETIRQTRADVTVAVMSGQFLQRGEPAFVDKWARTRMALLGGVDLVVELPYVFATGQARDFAKGAITILDALNCSSFCFGSEDGRIQPFLQTFELLEENREDYEAAIRKAVRTGISYPKALNIAYRSLTKETKEFIDLSLPNNILGYHYIEAAKRIHSRMAPATIKRTGAGYHDAARKDSPIASATGIRQVFFDSGELNDIRSFLPVSSVSEILRFQEQNHSFGSWQQFYPLLRFIILREQPGRLSRYAEVTEGIEHLLYEAATHSDSFEQFMKAAKSKRYTWTRIQRMLTHIYTGFTYEQARTFNSPEYIRILGMNKQGRAYLNEQKKDAKLPLISRAADLQSEMGKLDIHASIMYESGLGGTALKKEFTTPPIYAG